MRKLITTIVLASTVLSGTVFGAAAQIKVIYGADDRVDVAATKNHNYLNLAKSTAAMIPHHQVKELNAEQVELGGRTLEDAGVCKSERFAKQPTVANCSGFLVGKNILVTAGHCIQSQSDCEASDWVFDYKADYEDQAKVVVDKSSVYKCKSIISQKLDESTLADYAVIELDREVTDRKVLKFRTEGKPAVGDELVVIGHPSGLPSKIADGAMIRAVNDVYITANLDTYGGNSGSAVFNARTGVVEGILVRGETDYLYDEDKGCRTSNVISNEEGRGEEVTLITTVEGLPQAQAQQSK